MTLVAVVSAAVTATLVIGGGEALLRRSQDLAPTPQGKVPLVRTSS